MTSERTVRCPQCGEAFFDEVALREHGLEAHLPTRQELEEQRADAAMAQAMERERHQDAMGRREQAGQPGGSSGKSEFDRRRDRMNPARPGEDIGQQTQQQQRRVE
ncbi:MAG: hypothetical protein AB7G21_13670 [Dehalococcoidia bacterium]